MIKKILLWLLQPFFDVTLDAGDSTVKFSPALAWWLRTFIGNTDCAVMVRTKPYNDGVEHYAIVFGHGLDGAQVQLAQMTGSGLFDTGMLLYAPTVARIAADYGIVRRRFCLNAEWRDINDMDCFILKRTAR